MKNLKKSEKVLIKGLNPGTNVEAYSQKFMVVRISKSFMLFIHIDTYGSKIYVSSN